MQNLVQTCEQHLPSVEIVLVASNKPCAGIDFAAARGLPTAMIDPQTITAGKHRKQPLPKPSKQRQPIGFSLQATWPF